MEKTGWGKEKGDWGQRSARARLCTTDFTGISLRCHNSFLSQIQPAFGCNRFSYAPAFYAPNDPQQAFEHPLHSHLGVATIDTICTNWINCIYIWWLRLGDCGVDVWTLAVDHLNHRTRVHTITCCGQRLVGSLVGWTITRKTVGLHEKFWRSLDDQMVIVKV
jgi:hypothetical protein